MVNLNGSHADVKVYTVNGAAPGSASSLPDWLTQRRAQKGKRRSTKQEIESSIDLIQEFDFPEASNRIKTTPDGHHVYATGTYKPSMRVYDLDQLTLKFERHTNAENVDFVILSDDWTKTIHLQDNRTIEFHNQAGLYYTTRVPRMGRALAYHYPSCDALMGCVGNEVFRLNLDQGRFLNSLALSSDVEGVNAIDINPVHQLFAFGTQAGGDGSVEFWDPRSRSRVGILHMPLSQILPVGSAGDSAMEVTALSSRSDGLSLAVGTSTGHTLLYDLRSSRHFAIKDQGYGLRMKNVLWVEGGAKMAGDGMVISADSKVIKIWDRNSPSENFASVTPATDINHVHHVPGSGLLMAANEGTRMTSYYIPQLGPAPRWCSFLDHITEEMEEQTTRSVYEDYKFVERSELTKLGLDHLIGTKSLKPYMHGYFINLKLYDSARLIANPFAYEEHRETLVKQKVEKLVESRIRTKRVELPKVNRGLADKLQRDYERRMTVLARKREKAADADVEMEQKEAEPEKNADGENVLFDPRFKELFENPEFEVDTESREYFVLNPGGRTETKVASMRKGKTAVEEEAEESDKVSSDGLGHSSSSSSAGDAKNSDDEDQLVDMERYKRLRAQAREVRDDEKKKRTEKLAAFPHFKKFIEEQPTGMAYGPANAGVARGGKRESTFGERSVDVGAAPSKTTPRSRDDDFAMDADGGFELTWTPGEVKSKKGEGEQEKPEKKGKEKKEKRRKGVEAFGAGMEKGIPQETDETLSETQRHGRTNKRNKLRSASRNTFRGLAK